MIVSTHKEEGLMKRHWLILTIPIALVWLNASATIINIPDDYPTIQEGIDASTDGDTVLVHPGTYVENINFNGHNIVLGSLFLTTGDTTYIAETIIDGDSSGSVVTFESGEDSTAIISGLTIRNGFSDRGGGIYCFDGSNPIISFNIITENKAPGQFGKGGGICCWFSDPWILNNLVMQNVVRGEPGLGGGIFCYYSNPLISDNLIMENYAYGFIDGHGGGIYLFHSEPEIIGNMIARNHSPYGSGAAIQCRESNAVIVNNTISGNTGGPSVDIWDCNPLIRNTIIWSNTPSAIDTSRGSPDITYCDIEGGWEGEGNIDLDPLFIDPLNWNFNICSESPCIDTGDPETEDPDGTRSDIGKFFPDHPDCDSGNISFVSVDGDDNTGDGSRENPFRTIQHAVNVSYHQDTVLVLNGSYIENVAINYKNITLASNYIFSYDPIDIEMTIIDGGSVSSVISIDFCDSTTSVTGFTIVNGNAENGGGINCNGSDPGIRNNIISENIADHYGGGICCLDSNPEIYGNVIRQNTAGNGGGIFCRRSIPVIVNNHISANEVRGSGGGLYYSRDEMMFVIRDNVIDSNSARDGGGISFHGAIAYDLTTNNNIVTNNSADEKGGGIGLFSPNGLKIINFTISGNSAVYGGGIFCRSSSPDFINTILWNDYPQEIVSSYSYPEFTYCNIQGGWEGDGNIDVDPLFRDPENGDFHLMSTACGDPYDSPCIDSGSPAILDGLLDCSWGLGTVLSDMGAYGGGDSALVSIDGQDPRVPNQFTLTQNYPNPFNAATTLRYNLDQADNVALTIYNIIGQRIAIPFEGFQQAGEHAFIWDAANYPSGVYFARLEIQEQSKTIRMVLLK